MHLKATLRVAHTVKRGSMVNYDWMVTRARSHAMYLSYRVIVIPCVTTRGSSYQLFVRREPYALKFTFAGLVMINTSSVKDVDACLDEGIKCALTCMVNSQFCYMFEILDADIKIDTHIKKCLHSYFELQVDLRQPTPPGSLFLSGELHDGLYHTSFVPLTSGLPFKFEVEPSTAGGWRATLNSVSETDIKAKRFEIYRIISRAALQANVGANHLNFLRDLMRGCEYDFAQLYKVVPHEVLYGRPLVAAPTAPPPPMPDSPRAQKTKGGSQELPAAKVPRVEPMAPPPPMPDSPRVQETKAGSPEPAPTADTPPSIPSQYFEEGNPLPGLDLSSDDCDALVQSFWAEAK